MRDFLDFLKELLEKFFSSRLLLLGIIQVVLIAILATKLYNLQILHGTEYQEDYIEMTEKTVSSPASRGRIYDVNGNLLAYNQLAYDVVIRDNGEYKESADKNSMIYRLVKILNQQPETVQGEFLVKLDDSGNYQYTTKTKRAKLGFLRDVYGLKSIDELDDDEGKYPSDITAEELVEKEAERFKLDNITDSNGDPVELTKLEKLEIVNIRYTMSLTAYKKYEAVTVATSINGKTRIKISESAADLLGVGVEEVAHRVYNDAVYFSSIIGYTGKVQEDQLSELKAKDSTYTLNDTVGRIGIEQYLEDELHGTKGSKRLSVDNMGRIMNVISETQPVAGNDVYLTIDKNLQIGIYNLLERQLAGILTTKIVNEDDPNEEVNDASQIMIPVKDAYYQLISNNVLDMDAFAAEDADINQKTIYRKYEQYRSTTMQNLREELTGDNPHSLATLDEDMNQYMVYIYNKLSAEDIIVQSAIDQNSDYYKGWKADTISMRDFLYAGISNNWLDISVINVQSKYADANDIFFALVNYIENMLSEDRDFQKLNYKYLIKHNVVTGRELCMALLSQDVVKYNKEDYDRLSVGGEDVAYEFLIEKINNIEITPAQLALDPCTAGCVITDVNTGEVRALVSYPGYDNNKLTDNMDVSYYNKLIEDQSLPLYNNATQAKKAPGSTFKPITAVAGLEEGIIDADSEFTCTGIYDEISPPIRCWIYPGYHGALNVVGGIENSCNYFFSSIAHLMSMDEEGNYDTETGINTIAKYAAMFGLDHKSGVEITETEPNISTQAPEQSAMGQGTHSFANVQLSRYVSTVANRGTVFELSVLDKLTDTEGNLIKDYSPEVYSELEVKDETWNLVQEGMHKVTTEGSARNIFSDLDIDIAGKTGTAQESKTRGNHAFFISFAPFSNPEIAVTVNIPYGYSSANAATVARNVYRYYYGYLTLDEILQSGALGVYNVTIGD